MENNMESNTESNMENYQLVLPRKAGQTFPVMKLPTEVRLMIWQMALPESRIVELRTSHRHTGFYATARIPSLLHVNQESRNEALRFYSLTFGADDAPARTYFDFEVDVLYFNPHYFEKNATSAPWFLLPDLEVPKQAQGLGQIKKICIDEFNLSFLDEGASDSAVSLETVMVVTQHDLYAGQSGLAKNWRLVIHQGPGERAHYKLRDSVFGRETNAWMVDACVSSSAECICPDQDYRWWAAF